MLEIVKLMWNVFVLHDSIEKGDMTAGTWAAARQSNTKAADAGKGCQ